jgi:hypothetical protein
MIPKRKLLYFYPLTMSRYLVFKRSLYRSIKSINKIAKIKAEKVETTHINQRTGYDFFSAT